MILAPRNSFVIVDEPEMYLHKTILTKLWDKLETEREDCLFFYLTHDLVFATSRVSATKMWIKNFNYPDEWDIQKIESDIIPQTLLLELVGSQKNILFCEGEKGKIDEKIYNILFPNYTISPVGNCFQVISHTKAFNKIPNVTIKAIGLIDSDLHGKERLISLKRENIFSFEMVEPENLLLDECFLVKLATKVLRSEADIKEIKKSIILKLDELKQMQASNYVTAKIDYYFTDSNISKGNDIETVKLNMKQFINEVNIDEWYRIRIEKLENLIKENDYKEILKVFNNKGLKQIASKNLKLEISPIKL